jgi:glycosyltransferase involved in cell wall biosynthesis
MSQARQLRVVQFLNGTTRSGAEEVALELARGIDPNRFSSYLVCPQVLLEAFAEDRNQASVKSFPLSLDSPWRCQAARNFVAFLRSERIDIVHAHMIRAALAAVPLARLAGVPLVLQTCHGREAWRTSWLKRRFWIDRRIANWSDAIVAVSQSTAAYLAEVKHIQPNKIRVIRNGRPVVGFDRLTLRREQSLRNELGIVPNNFTIGVFGRLEAQKGHTYLLQALPAVRDKFPAAKVLFVGEGPSRNVLETEVRSKGLDSCVMFTGYRTDCRDLMAICDLIVLPSLFEGMPLVLIEAALLGKPVIATAVDGTKEVIVDGITGVLVPPAQPAALARALVELLPDRRRLSTLGSQARIYAQQSFSLDRQIRETEALYLALMPNSIGTRGVQACNLGRSTFLGAGDRSIRSRMSGREPFYVGETSK